MADWTQAYPGYTLKSYDIESQSASAGFRRHVSMDTSETGKPCVQTPVRRERCHYRSAQGPLTRDRIRAVRAGASYDIADNWAGQNTVNVTLSQGLPGLGASDKDDPYLSRAGAIALFTKTELAFSRVQGITEDWSVFLAARANWPQERSMPRKSSAMAVRLLAARMMPPTSPATRVSPDRWSFVMAAGATGLPSASNLTLFATKAACGVLPPVPCGQKRELRQGSGCGF